MIDEKTRGRLLALAPAAGYLAGVILLFGKVLWSGSAIVSAPLQDLDGYYVAMRTFGFSQLKQGNLPLWNPYLFSGIGYFANFESALLYPPNWLYLVLPMERAINLGVALHAFMAGFFTYLWCRRRGTSRLGSWLSGLIFMFSGPYVLHVFPGHLSNLCVMAWTPLLFLALDGWFETGRARWCLLGTAVVSLQILAGHPQYVYYTAMAAVLYSVLRLFREPRRLELGAGAAAMYAGAALLCAVQLLTGIQNVEEMTRGGGPQYYFSRTFPFAPENLLTMLVPNLFGDMIKLPYYGRWHLWEDSLFVGVGGLLLACLALTGRKGVPRRLELAMALNAVVLAFGVQVPLLYEFLYDYLPGFSLFRGASKFVYIAGLFLAALAGVGFDRLRGGERPPVRLAAAAAALGAALTGMWFWLSRADNWGQWTLWKTVFQSLGSSTESFYPVKLFHSESAVRAATLFASGEILLCGRMLLLTALVLFLLRYSKRWIYGLAALIALEMFLFAHHFKIETRLAPPYPQSWREIAANDPGDYRVLHIGLLTRNPVMAAGVQDVWGYSPLYMSRYSRLMEFVWRLAPSDKKENPRRLLVKNPILALLRCRYIFLNTGDKAVLRVPDMPRLLLIDDWLPMTDPDKIFKKLMDPGFDARKTVILEAPPDPLPVKSKRPAGTVALLGSGTDWLEFEAELSRPAILLITDGYSASWRVRPLVPGPQARYSVMPADYTLRAVPLTAGKHRLRMEYLPSAFVVGKWISLAALIAYAALCLYFLRRRPR